MIIPAHKVIGDEHKPGQLVSSPVSETPPRDERFLNEYIARKTDDFNYFPKPKECCGNPFRGCQECPPPKKLTFADWFAERTRNFDEGKLIYWEDFELVAKQAWEASKEN